jgi:hypothetical protein
MLDTYTAIEAWNEDDLTDLPQQETDEYEYKSSRIRENPEKYRSELQAKVCKAASAFWNTGGGVLVVGVDDEGNIDGGIPVMMGRQRLRDWVDQVLNTVVPIGTYAVKCIAPEKTDSKIEPQHVVLVIGFGESFDLPHMAPDNRYYVRAGAHSNPANHYLVEAIRARRGLRRPMLRGLLREHPRKLGVVELVILAVNDMPALNVQIRFQPLPALYRDDFSDKFPLVIPVIDRETPFRMDVARLDKQTDWLNIEPVTLYLRYQGMMGKPIEEHQLLDQQHSLAPLQLAGKSDDNTRKNLKRIAHELERLTELLEERLIDKALPENIES